LLTQEEEALLHEFSLPVLPENAPCRQQKYSGVKNKRETTTLIKNRREQDSSLFPPHSVQTELFFSAATAATYHHISEKISSSCSLEVIRLSTLPVITVVAAVVAVEEEVPMSILPSCTRC
jgi:hypothetical protein